MGSRKARAIDWTVQKPTKQDFGVGSQNLKEKRQVGCNFMVSQY